MPSFRRILEKKRIFVVWIPHYELSDYFSSVTSYIKQKLGFFVLESRKFRTTEISLIKFYKTVILPAVLRVYETWSLALRKWNISWGYSGIRCRARYLEQRKEWRNFHNAELHGLHSPPNICWVIKSRRIIIRKGLVTPEEDRKGAYRILVENPERNIPLGRPRRRR